MKKLILHICLLFSIFCFAQDKMEYEKRINEDELPQPAALLINPFEPELAKLRYYSESDGDKTSFEVKFKHKGNRYSVEFDPSGKLEDVEIRGRYQDIDAKAFEKIKAYLDSGYGRWRIEKIQFQYLPKNSDKELLEDLLGGKALAHDMLEIIIWCKKGTSKKAYEMSFKPDGTFVDKREVVLSEHDFLSF